MQGTSFYIETPPLFIPLTTTKNNAYITLHLSILLAGGTGLFGRLISVGEVPLVCIRVILAAIIMLMVMKANELNASFWIGITLIIASVVLQTRGSKSPNA